MERFEASAHILYLSKSLYQLPHYYTETETNRATLLFFCLSGLDLLGAVDTHVTKDQKRSVIEWIYLLQVEKGPGQASGGFRGSPPLLPDRAACQSSLDGAHLVNTYACLMSLVVLGDDLSRVDRQGLLLFLKDCQMQNGSFRACQESESDMRFVYCASVICWLLKDWTCFHIPSALSYIASSHNYDGGFGQGPLLESHGGSTFCAVASLHLMQQALPSSAANSRIANWCLHRQLTGFQGRTNKPPDSCYSYWIGSALSILGAIEAVDAQESKRFLYACQNPTGGFSKHPGMRSDLLHTFASLAGLALVQEPALKPLDHFLGISKEAISHYWRCHDKQSHGEE